MVIVGYVAWVAPHTWGLLAGTFLGMLTMSGTHELGHIFMAWVCGFSVTSIRIGKGKWPSVTFHIGKTVIVVSLPPFTGEVIEDTRGRATPFKIQAYAFGGGLFNFLAIILTIVLVGAGHSWATVGFCVTQAVGVLNLYPFKRWDRTANIQYWSDGMGLKAPLDFLENSKKVRTSIIFSSSNGGKSKGRNHV